MQLLGAHWSDASLSEVVRFERPGDKELGQTTQALALGLGGVWAVETLRGRQRGSWRGGGRVGTGRSWGPSGHSGEGGFLLSGSGRL